MNIINLIRWLHIISGTAWLGEVITINFVLVPALLKMDIENQKEFVRKTFPRVFRLASVLSLTAILSGALMSYLITGWQNLPQLLGTRWGLGIFGGGSLALLLALFHFLVESRLKPIASSATEEDVEQIITILKIVPRAGLAVILLIVLLMMYAARGL